MGNLTPLRGWFSLTGRRAHLGYFLSTLAAVGVAGVGAALGIAMAGFGENSGWAAAPGLILMLASMVFASPAASTPAAPRSRRSASSTVVCTLPPAGIRRGLGDAA